MKHRAEIIRVAVIDSAEFSLGQLAAFKHAEADNEHPIIYTDQLIPVEETAEEFMNELIFQ